MENRTVVSFYQNNAGEICALAEDYKDGRYIYRLVENIERMNFSSENIGEEVSRGFDDFSEFNPSEFSGLTFGEIAFEITEGEEYRLVAEFSDNISGFVPENMDNRAKELFEPLMDSAYSAFEKTVYSPSVHESQICFFAA